MYALQTAYLLEEAGINAAVDITDGMVHEHSIEGSSLVPALVGIEPQLASVN
jgi:hypothetical protein